jgi:hypothetical protein
MDTACLGVVLVSRTGDTISKDAMVSVDVADVGGLRGRACGVCLGNGHDEAMRLRHDKRSDQDARSGNRMGAPHTKKRSRLRRSL